jgi:hypothetical protein
MDYSTKSLTENEKGVREPLAGGRVPDVALVGKGDLSDWVELMDAVEALCPVWPERGGGRGGNDWRL